MAYQGAFVDGQNRAFAEKRQVRQKQELVDQFLHKLEGELSSLENPTQVKIVVRDGRLLATCDNAFETDDIFEFKNDDIFEVRYSDEYGWIVSPTDSINPDAKNYLTAERIDSNDSESNAPRIIIEAFGYWCTKQSQS